MTFVPTPRPRRPHFSLRRLPICPPLLGSHLGTVARGPRIPDNRKILLFLLFPLYSHPRITVTMLKHGGGYPGPPCASHAWIMRATRPRRQKHEKLFNLSNYLISFKIGKYKYIKILKNIKGLPNFC